MIKRFFQVAFCALISLPGLSQTTFPEEGIKDKKAVYHLLENAVVHSGRGDSELMSILVHKGEIASMGKAEDLDIPKNTVKHNLKGYHIYPSFIEINSTYGIGEYREKQKTPGPDPDRRENKALHWNEAVHPETRAVQYFSPDGEEAKKMRGMGFGVALSQVRDGIIRGSSVLSLLGEGTANENVLLSEASMNYSFDKGSSSQDYPSSLMGSIALLRQTFYDLNGYKNASEKETNYSLEALLMSSEKPALFEIEDKYDLLRVANLASEFDNEFIVLGTGDLYQIRDIPEGIKAIVAPLDFPKPYDMSDPDLSRYVDQADLMHWEAAPFNPAILKSRDIDLVLSAQGIESSADFFASVRKAVKSGLPADEALAALTSIPAKLMGMDQKIGSLAPGYIANFFVTKGDLFTDPEAKIISHWINGNRFIIDDPDAIALKGTYTLNVNDVYYVLEVEGDSKYKGKVIAIENTDTVTATAKIGLQSNVVSLQFAMKPEEGYYRLSGVILSDNRIWDGQGINPMGKKVTWSALRRKQKPETKKDTLSSDSTMVEMPSMRYPFKAYGFDSLPAPEMVLIKNATLWTNDSLGVVRKGSVLMADGKILAVGKNLDPNQYLSKKEKGNFTEIDGTGKHLTPGIIDEHSHIAITRGVNEGTQASTAEVRIADALNPDDINIYRQLAGGVTTAQLLHGSANPIGGQSAIIKLRWGSDYEGMLFSEAPGFIKFALGENVKQTNWGDQYRTRYPQTRMGVEQVYYDYFYRAKEYEELKKIALSSREANTKKKKKDQNQRSDFRTDIELEALLEILNGERFITCHSYVQSEINMLMHVADSMGFTVNTFTHILEGYKLADKMKSHGAAGSTFSDWWAYKYEVKDAIPYNASLMQKAGVLTAINSDDAEMGRRLNQEAAKSIKYGGMSEEEALKMVTLNPAIMLHIDEYVGSLSPGKHADLVIWDGHPLSVYSKVEKTFIDGIPYFDRERDAQLRERDAAERARIAKLMEDAAAEGSDVKKPARKMERYYHCDTTD